MSERRRAFVTRGPDAMRQGGDANAEVPAGVARLVHLLPAGTPEQAEQGVGLKWPEGRGAPVKKRGGKKKRVSKKQETPFKNKVQN